MPLHRRQMLSSTALTGAAALTAASGVTATGSRRPHCVGSPFRVAVFRHVEAPQSAVPAVAFRGE